MLFVREWARSKRKHSWDDDDIDEEPIDSESSDSESSDADLAPFDAVDSGSDSGLSGSEDMYRDEESNPDPSKLDLGAVDISETTMLEPSLDMRRDPFRYHDKSLITVLDRLHDGGSHLTRLGLCLDLETQWVGFFYPLNLV